MKSETRFEPMRMKNGLGWRVLVRGPGGTIQYISGFVSETDALKWIEEEGPTWQIKSEGALNRI